MSDPTVTLRDIYRARRRIAGIAVRTPLIESPQLTDDLGAPVYLKLENVQRTGAFKIRGAANKLQALSDEERRRGVITVSSGNHGRAVAYVARELGYPPVSTSHLPMYRKMFHKFKDHKDVLPWRIRVRLRYDPAV